MSMRARPFQAKMIEDARAALREHDMIIIRAPTGAGKTVIGTLIGQGAFDRGRRVMFTVHRDFLVEQTSATFTEVGLPHGQIAAGVTPERRNPVQIAAIDTLKNRMDRVLRPDLLVVDEGHHSVAAGWLKVIEAYVAEGTKVIALTATPARLDGRGLDEAGYTHMVDGPSTRWLIDEAYLCDYDAYAPSTADLSGVHTRMGDFNRSEAEAAVDKPTITGSAIEHYKKLANGKRAVAFCASIKHSEHVCAQFNAAGIPAAHIDGTTDKGVRKSLLAKFRRGEILVLTSVDIFGEGFDLPAVECAILLRPTQSLSLHLQQIGRALRPVYAKGMPQDTREERLAAMAAGGKGNAIILDHVGNLTRLGLPDSDFEWSLQGRKRKAGKAGQEFPIRQCENCYAVFPPAPACPSCGHVLPKTSRELEEIDGELQRINKETLRAQKAAEKAAEQAAKLAEREASRAEKAVRRAEEKELSLRARREVGMARTLEDLERIAKERNYDHRWVERQWGMKEAAANARAEAQARAYMRN